MRKALINITTFIVLILVTITGSSFSVLPVSLGDLFITAINKSAPLAPQFISYTDDESNGAGINSAHELNGAGLNEATLNISVPIFLHAGFTLESKINIADVEPGLECLLIWYVDDKAIFEEWIVTSTDIDVITFSHDFEYSRIMPETAEIRATLRHITPQGETQEISNSSIVTLGNFSDEYWMEQELERVLELATSVYKGDRTLEWALENDLDEFDKLVFANAGGYESETEYLVWVDRAHQRMNIFEGSAGEWELTKTFIIATGGPGTATHKGVTTISSRSRGGWGFEDRGFRVYPVVRFFQERPESYAFHSRPKEFGSQNFTDDRIGFPVSAGCIRMYDEDIWYLFNEIPDNTTVIIH